MHELLGFKVRHTQESALKIKLVFDHVMIIAIKTKSINPYLAQTIRASYKILPTNHRQY